MLVAERIYQKSNNPPTTATYQYRDLALIGVVIEYPAAEKSGGCVLLSCTDKRSRHEGSSVTFGLHSYADTLDCIVSFLTSPTPKPIYDMISRLSYV